MFCHHLRDMTQGDEEGYARIGGAKDSHGSEDSIARQDGFY